MNLDINYSQIIINTINELLSSFISSIDNNLYTLLDELLFIKPDILQSSFLNSIISSNILVYVANSLSIGILLYYCFKLLFSSYTGSNVESPYQFFFKLIIYTLLANNFVSIIELILYFNNLLSSSVQVIGASLSASTPSFATLIQRINIITSFSADEGFNFISFSGFIHSFMVFGLLNILLSLSLRYIMVCLFILLSPFAFISLISSSTAWLFKTWLRSFLSLLVLQIFTALLLLFVLVIPIDNNYISIIFFVGLLNAISRINLYIKELFGGISTEINANINSLKSILQRS